MLALNTMLPTDFDDVGGVEDEDFTLLNFTTSGSLFTARQRIRRKLIFDDIDLLDVPGVLLVITRLYRLRIQRNSSRLRM